MIGPFPRKPQTGRFKVLILEPDDCSLVLSLSMSDLEQFAYVFLKVKSGIIQKVSAGFWVLRFTAKEYVLNQELARTFIHAYVLIGIVRKIKISK